MTRFQDWQSRLEEFLRINGNRKFKYGQWDCCLFVCDAIKAMTGVDPAANLRGWYQTKWQAFDLIGKRVSNYTRAQAVELIVEHVTAEHSMPEIALSKARRGDVALIRRTRGMSLGIVGLDGASVIVVTEKHLARVPFGRIREARAWRVG